MLKNEYLLAKIGFDAAEIEHPKVGKRMNWGFITSPRFEKCMSPRSASFTAVPAETDLKE